MRQTFALSLHERFIGKIVRTYPYSIDSKRFLRKPISNFELLDCAAAMIKHPREMIDLCVN